MSTGKANKSDLINATYVLCLQIKNFTNAQKFFWLNQNVYNILSGRVFLKKKT